MNKLKNYIDTSNWLKNILYLIGIIIATIPFCLINYLQLEILNDKPVQPNINVSFTIFDYIYSINNIVLVLILIVPAIILDKIQNIKPMYSIGINLDKYAIRDIIIGAALATLAIGGITFNNLIQTNYNINISTANMLTFFNTTAEELFFRGYIFQTICRKNNYIVAIIISSILFAVTHFINTNSLDIIYFFNIFIAGILFSFMYIKTKSIWCSITFHFIWNFLIEITNQYNIEHNFICAFILIILIFAIQKILKPSYKINKYNLINDY